MLDVRGIDVEKRGGDGGKDNGEDGEESRWGATRRDDRRRGEARPHTEQDLGGGEGVLLEMA